MVKYYLYYYCWLSLPKANRLKYANYNQENSGRESEFILAAIDDMLYSFLINSLLPVCFD